MPNETKAPTHKEIYELYKTFIRDEQAFNDKIMDGDIDWYSNIVGVDDHFERDILNTLGQAEPLTIKRLLILNAFEHIAAMERAQSFRKLDYLDYFARRDISLEDDNETMDGILNYLHNTIT